MKKPIVAVVQDDAARLTSLRDSIQISIHTLESDMLETVRVVGGALLEARALLGNEDYALDHWIENHLGGCMSTQNARKWMAFTLGLRSCPALESGDMNKLGFAARSVFASALLQDRISSSEIESLIQALPTSGKITQASARDLVKRFEQLSNVTLLAPTTGAPRVLKTRQPDEKFDLHAVDLERAARENPSLAAALVEAETNPVMPEDPRLIDLINGLGGWDEFVTWLAAFQISSDLNNPPTPNPPKLAKRFVLVDDDGHGTRKALKLFALLVQAAQVCDMSL